MNDFLFTQILTELEDAVGRENCSTKEIDKVTRSVDYFWLYDNAETATPIKKIVGETKPIAKNTEQYQKIFKRYKKISEFYLRISHET